MAYDRVMRLAWDFLLHSVPLESNGLKTYFSYCCMDALGQHTEDWPNDPTSVYRAFADSAVVYYAYSGDTALVKLVQELLGCRFARLYRRRRCACSMNWCGSRRVGFTISAVAPHRVELDVVLPSHEWPLRRVFRGR
jgi:hypothetical protein